jgi:hypothetical protein
MVEMTSLTRPSKDDPGPDGETSSHMVEMTSLTRPSEYDPSVKSDPKTTTRR